MGKITGKINLMNLHAVRKQINGTAGPVECLVIPIAKNKLFVGEKGVYLDIVAFEITKTREGSKDTHLVKQSLPKEERDKMTEEQLKAMPILGNLTANTDSYTEPAPVSNMQVQSDIDDLPF